jgi:hypothetical protein
VGVSLGHTVRLLGAGTLAMSDSRKRPAFSPSTRVEHGREAPQGLSEPSGRYLFEHAATHATPKENIGSV